MKNKICDYFLETLGRETCFTDLEFLDDELSHKFVVQGFWNHEASPLEWKSEAEVVVHRAEFWETFRDCLAKLPQRIADVFMLREMEEMETSKICGALNISPNATTEAVSFLRRGDKSSAQSRTVIETARIAAAAHAFNVIGVAG